MILNAEKTVETSITGLESKRFSVAVTSKTFRTLIDGLYSDKVSAVIRELSTNAWDSHKDAGKESTPFQVHIPTVLEPYFSVRDFGTSMSHDQIMDLYTTVFASTKTDSNEFVGALGLGSKSPFAISDSFTVTAYLEGSARLYLASLDTDGVPIITFLSSEPSEEPDGILVSVTPPESIRFRFHEAANDVYRAFDVPPVCNVELKFPKVITVGEGYKVYSSLNFSYGDSIAVRQGTVIYPVRDRQISSPVTNGHQLVIDVPIGTVDVATSRETLSLTESTISELKDRIATVSVHLEADALSKITDAKTFYDANEALNGILPMFSSYDRPASLRKPEWGGRVVTGHLSRVITTDYSSSNKGSERWEKLTVVTTPGKPEERVFIIDRDDCKIPRKRLRIRTFGKLHTPTADGRILVLHNPSKKAIKGILEALRRDKVTFVDASILPDVRYVNKDGSPRKTAGGVSGVYELSGGELQKMQALPEEPYIAALIDRGARNPKVLTDFGNGTCSNLTGLFHDVRGITGLKIIFMTKTAIKRYAPTHTLDRVISAHIEATVNAYAAQKAYGKLRSTLGVDISVMKALGLPDPDATNYRYHNLYQLERVSSTVDLAMVEAVKLAETICEKYPMLKPTPEAIIEYIKNNNTESEVAA